MCGIIAYIGDQGGFDKSLDGLKMLQNRGYDSSGVCSISDNSLVLDKFASRPDKTGVQLLEECRSRHQTCSTVIMHTRWATHGAKTDANSHPHLDHKRRFAIVHNGIIENYSSLKQELLSQGVVFSSETDTEVVVNLISSIYDNLGDIPDRINKAITGAVSRLEGTWGLIVVALEEPNRLYCARHGSPLLVGFSDRYLMVASEQSGFCSYVNNYICLNDNDIIVLEKTDTGVQFTKAHEYEIRQIVSNNSLTTPAPYEHWTIREIHEQYDSVTRAIGMGGRIQSDTEVRLGGLNRCSEELIKIDNLILLGCGTSYNAGAHCLNLLKKISGFNTVQLFDGAEFTEYDIPKLGTTAAIFLSQSGETKDLHRCIEIAKNSNMYMIGVVNVVDSMIAREVNCGVYLNAGKEVAVASTKVFTSQVIVLNMIAVWFAQKRGINDNMRAKIIEGLRRLPLDIRATVESVKNNCQQVAEYLLDKYSLFILGKDRCESIADEGALKIKEIGYINANGYSSSALRHGPFALLEEGTPVVIVVPQDGNFSKNMNVLEEVKSRGAFTVGISDGEAPGFDISVRVPFNEPFSGLLSVVPLQIISYQLAVLKGHNPDFPRNLAKTITVE